MVRSGALPEGMISNGHLRNPFGGGIYLEPGNQSGFTMRFGGLPGWACARLATREVPDAMRYAVSVGGGDPAVRATPFDVAEAVSACGPPNGVASVKWSFRQDR